MIKLGLSGNIHLFLFSYGVSIAIIIFAIKPENTTYDLGKIAVVSICATGFVLANS